MQQRFALLLGNGKYAIDLHAKLRKTGVAALSVALFPSLETQLIGADYCIDILDPAEVLRVLTQHQITHFVFGGNFKLTHIAAMWLTHPLTALRILRADEYRKIAFNLLRGRSSAALIDFHQLLRDHHFEPVLASDLLAELRPGAGVLFSDQQQLAAADPLTSLIAGSVVQSLEELRAQPFANPRQAFLFDGKAIALRDSSGTDSLLGKAQGQRKTVTPRLLVKLCPPGFDPRLDPPVVGPKTFELAAAAAVDVVVLDAVNGILFDRAEVARLCQQGGIRVIGVDPASFSQALPSRCVPAA